MLKDFSTAGMIKWDGFGWELPRIAYCIVLHHMAWHNNFTTPTMFQLLNIQLFQFRKIYDIV